MEPGYIQLTKDIIIESLIDLLKIKFSDDTIINKINKSLYIDQIELNKIEIQIKHTDEQQLRKIAYDLSPLINDNFKYAFA